MIAIKIECDCGQHYAFDVEPVNGRMPTSVVCPSCGADGTPTANAIIAQSLAAQPAPSPAAPVFARVDAPPLPPPPAMQRFASPAAKPPPIPPVAARPQAAVAGIKADKHGNDGWASEETGLNKLGTWITVIPPIFATMLPWQIMGVELPILTTCVVVGILGMVGGAINILGRGPIVAGALIGLCIAVGGYGATAYWLHGKVSVHKVELLIAFAIGAAPGFILQVLIQKVLQKRARAAVA